jgi:phosphate acetyltransferase
MLVYEGKADGMVSGATHSTANTVRPALQIIKTKKGMSRVSGAMIMERKDEKYIFADCAINIDPDSETLAEIAYQSSKTAEMVGLDPKIAMLSFSTKGSAKGPMVTKVQDATDLVHQKYPDLVCDGELQFDAAVVPRVGEAKAPGSAVAGHANVFIFPELQSGNISYKVAERLGGFSAIGPVLQGLAAPINDLSRGCKTEDVYLLAILTAAQANMEK